MMKQKNLFREFSGYIALNVCGMIGLSCYILADTFFIARGLGADGLTALNLAIPVYSLIHGSGLMLGMGGATKFSVFSGQKQYRNANKAFSAAVCLAIMFSAVFMLAGIFLADAIAVLLKAEGRVFTMTKTYLQVILLFSPAFMLNDILICFVRNDKGPRLSMAAMLAGSLANIIMDYVLIFPLQMGILGAVLATGTAPVISMCILSRHWAGGQSHIRLEGPAISPESAFSILSLGIPSLITEVASGIVIIVFNLLILRLRGNIGVAAYGVVANLSLVVISIYTGIAQGMQPIISRAYGCGNKPEMKTILGYAVITVAVASVCIYSVFFAGADGIARMFNQEGNRQLQQIAVTGLKLYFTAIPFAGFNIILSTYFTSMEKALPAQVISLSRGFFLIIPMAFFLAAVLGMAGVWLSFPAAELLVSGIGAAWYKAESHSDVTAS